MKNKQGTPTIKDSMQMFKKHLAKVFIVISLSTVLQIIGFQSLHAQIFGGTFENKWLWVSSLRHYFSSAGAEITYA